MSNDPYRVPENIVGNDKAKEILRNKGIVVEEKSGLEALEMGIVLGFLMLQESFTANDYVHGPFETYMLKTHGIIVDQPNPMDSYTVYHVVEIGYTGGNE